MPQVPEESRWLTIEGFVEAFETAFAASDEVAVGDFLPARDSLLYLPVLRELVRVDLELSWSRGRRRRLDEYFASYPELFEDAASVRDIAYEEYRVRRQSGECPSPDEYRSRFGVDTAEWPAESDRVAALADDDCDAVPVGAADEINGQTSHSHDASRSGRFRPHHGNCSPRKGDSFNSTPEVGGEFLGFDLVAELGRGAFGRVFLARQASLANRWIVLKVSQDAAGEPQTLAQLQHTHIVPVYSVHRRGPWQAVCMPFLGSTTLADVLAELRGRGSWPDSGLELLSTVVNRQHRVACTVGRPLAEVLRRASGRPQAIHAIGAAHLSRGDEVAGIGQAAPSPLPLSSRRGGRGVGGEGASGRDGSSAVFDALEHLNFVEAVVWIAARLADGLAHAHERGILHCDLKPANILLTDECQPMLLDFNLAADTKSPPSAAAALIGGTLPYMAPEQLDSLQHSQPATDARSDIFALGVILFELLTGRPPFPVRQGSLESVLPEMIVDRRGAPPRLRVWNDAVSLAVESIVRHCLEPDPARRYQSARELQDDLERHLDNLPLRHTAEPSLGERARKWARRHPRLISSGGIAAVAVAALTVLVAALFVRGERIARLEAAEQFSRFSEASKSVQALLAAADFEPTRRAEGLAAARDALQIYRVLDNAAWQDSRTVRRLGGDDAARLRSAVADVLLAMARPYAAPADEPESGGRAASPDEARKLNRLAESCFPPGEVPRAVWLQRAEFARTAGEGQRLEELADRTPLRTATDPFQVAAEHASRGRYADALPLLDQAGRHDPQNLTVRFTRGICHAGLGRFADAAAEFQVCAALWPDSHWPHFQQSLAWLDAREFVKARVALDHAIELCPDHAESTINHGLARYGMGDFAGAVLDYTRAIDLGATQTRVYFMRANARQRSGDAAGAQQDRELGLSREPTDELSWIARGVARLGGDPPGALADFEHALTLNPRSREAMQNKSHVLSERMGKTEEAVEVLDTAVALHPNYILARAGRGVLLARLGRRDAAHTDATETTARDSRPGTLYQVAGIYALTSREQPEDRAQALRLLAAAIRQDPKWFAVVPQDPDLDPIRDDAEFHQLMRSLAEINAVGVPKATK
jgi:serine/threonine protein kinase/Flp pilus assembly protein TadD